MKQNEIDVLTLRTMVRSAYDFQKLRISIGNRITRNFKHKLGQEDDGMSEEEMEQESINILAKLRQSYNRITDAVVLEGEEHLNSGKLPTEKKFKGDDIITEYSELLLVNNYLNMLASEQRNFRDMEKILSKIPIWTQWLSTVPGVGPAMAAVIVSEIDIHKAQYSASLHKLAGIDVVRVGSFKDASGKEITVYPDILDEFFSVPENEGKDFYYKHTDGKEYKVFIRWEGRSKKDYCLVDREYLTREKELKTKKSITFNPFLKTKLMGVLAASFIKVGGSVKVDGVKMGKARRIELAKEHGFNTKNFKPEELDNASTQFLRAIGKEVVIERNKYTQIYYDYKNRLANAPEHQSKTPKHRHNMALRYMMKFFLIDLYEQWRTLEGLEVVPPYHEAKLGLYHNQHNEHSL